MTGLYPATEVMAILPEMLDPTSKSSSRVNRIHSQVVKDSLRLQLQFHHTVRIPDHFNFYRQKKYNLKKRSPATVKLKRKKRMDPADLVRTGKTKTEATISRRIRVGGSTQGGKVVGTLIMRTKPGMKDGATSYKVADLKREITTVAPAEEVRMTEHFRRDYARLIRERLKPRTQVRMAARLGALGL